MNRKTMSFWSGATSLLLVGTYALAGCMLGPEPEPANASVGSTSEALLSSPSVVAWGALGGLRAFHESFNAPGILYWTESSSGVGYSARVHSGSEGTTPGTETTLYAEASPYPVGFGAITTANPGAWYLYFVVNYTAGISQIKRVPVSGGAATVLATSPATIGARQAIEADATDLYWADDGGVRKMPLAGGTITTLAAMPNVVGLGLQRGLVYFASGTGVYSVPKGGGAPTLRDSGQDVITSFHVRPEIGGSGPTGPRTTALLTWTERKGRVAEKFVKDSGADVPTGIVFVSPPGYDAMSVHALDGARIAWTICTTPGNTNCLAYIRDGVITTSTAAGAGARFMQITTNTPTFHSRLFWANADALETTAFAVAPPPPPPPCISTGNPCASQCSGTATDNCGTVFTCHASCGMEGLCPCAGGKCTSGACVCKTGPCN